MDPCPISHIELFHDVMKFTILKVFFQSCSLTMADMRKKEEKS